MFVIQDRRSGSLAWRDAWAFETLPSAVALIMLLVADPLERAVLRHSLGVGDEVTLPSGKNTVRIIEADACPALIAKLHPEHDTLTFPE